MLIGLQRPEVRTNGIGNSRTVTSPLSLTSASISNGHSLDYGISARDRRITRSCRIACYFLPRRLRGFSRRICRRRHLLRHQRLSDHKHHPVETRAGYVFPGRLLRATRAAHLAGAVPCHARVHAIRLAVVAAERHEELFASSSATPAFASNILFWREVGYFDIGAELEAVAAHLEPRGRRTVLPRLPFDFWIALEAQEALDLRSSCRYRGGQPGSGAMGSLQQTRCDVLPAADAHLGIDDRRLHRRLWVPLACPFRPDGAEQAGCKSLRIDRRAADCLRTRSTNTRRFHPPTPSCRPWGLP